MVQQLRLCFHCRGQGHSPWLGNWDPTCHVVQPKKKKRNLAAKQASFHIAHCLMKTRQPSLEDHTNQQLRLHGIFWTWLLRSNFTLVTFSTKREPLLFNNNPRVKAQIDWYSTHVKSVIEINSIWETIWRTSLAFLLVTGAKQNIKTDAAWFIRT